MIEVFKREEGSMAKRMNQRALKEAVADALSDAFQGNTEKIVPCEDLSGSRYYLAALTVAYVRPMIFCTENLPNVQRRRVEELHSFFRAFPQARTALAKILNGDQDNAKPVLGGYFHYVMWHVSS